MYVRSLGLMDNGVPARKGRRLWCGVAVVLMLAPAVIAPPGAWLTAIAAASALAMSIPVWPAGRIALDHAAAGAAVLSLAVDIGYFGQPGLVLLWFPFEMLALLVLLQRAVRRVPVPRVAVIGSLTGVAVIMLPLRFTLHAPRTGLAESVFAASSALLPAACATGVGLYLRSLDNRRTHAVALARREQRLEVARDLHDFVAHEVTGIVLEAQAAQLEPEGTTSDRELLARIEKAGLRALDSMDRMVLTLREAEDRKWDEPPPTRLHGLADLPELVGSFSSMAAAQVELALEGGLAGTLPPEVEDTAYRVALESLTNVRRHSSHASLVNVFAGRTADGAVELLVTDNGRHGPPASARQGGGTGLAGLAERVSALGGRLDAGPLDNGWRVRCLLPMAATR